MLSFLSIGRVADMEARIKDVCFIARTCRSSAGAAVLASWVKICAWIVTSSAVVALVSDQDVGVAGERYGDHHTLAPPAQ